MPRARFAAFHLGSPGPGDRTMRRKSGHEGIVPVKILELGKFCPPHRAGIETLLQSWCEGFAAKGAEVDCVVANDEASTTHETVNRVRLHRLASFGLLLSTSLCPCYFRATRRFRADLWHSHF